MTTIKGEIIPNVFLTFCPLVAKPRNIRRHNFLHEPMLPRGTYVPSFGSIASAVGKMENIISTSTLWPLSGQNAYNISCLLTRCTYHKNLVELQPLLREILYQTCFRTTLTSVTSKVGQIKNPEDMWCIFGRSTYHIFFKFFGPLLREKSHFFCFDLWVAGNSSEYPCANPTPFDSAYLTYWFLVRGYRSCSMDYARHLIRCLCMP